MKQPETLVKDTIDMVREWHEAFGVPNSDSPNINDDDLNALRFDLIQEELWELRDAMQDHDAAAALDALTDLQYVLDGAYLQLGLAKYKQAAFEEVQRSNMSKLDEDGKPIRREDGKILKGPNYSPPDLERVMREVDNG